MEGHLELMVKFSEEQDEKMKNLEVQNGVLRNKLESAGVQVSVSLEVD